MIIVSAQVWDAIQPHHADIKKRNMGTIGNSILALSIIWVLWQFIRTRRRAREGEIIVPPFFAALLIFSLCVIGVIALHISPFHFIWLLPVSYLLGTVLLLFPGVQKITMTFLLMLAMTRSLEEEERGQVVSQREKKRPKREAGSKRRKR